MRHIPIPVVQWSVFTISLVDGLFVAVMMLWTGGYDSLLFWIFLALLVRNSVSIPPGISQITLNLGIVVCYVLSCGGGFALANSLRDNERNEDTLRIMGLSNDHGTFDAIFVRTALLTLFAVCCYGLQVLLERQRHEIEEATEFTAREVQLRSAGRLAAEFAHQVKNPLAIINTALFSLQRALNENRGDAHAQIEIIREEVSRSDRIITQVMDYAQLTEGYLEKLDLVEELTRALEQVFPAAASRNIRVERDFGRNLPALVMQRPHLSEILVNLLQNAREAVKENGTVTIQAVTRADRAVEIVVSDTGEGIPPDKVARVFEAYYTTKEKGSGLGLSIVRHNAELYGGTVRVESGAGKGARFVIEFPAKTLVKLNRQKI
jgi:signal transduction histidine kinase